MRKHVISVLSTIALTVLLSVAFAAEQNSTTIQSGATIIETHNGQTFEMTTVNVVVEVTFLSVTGRGVNGRATKVGGHSGTLTIRWIEGSQTTTVSLSPNQPERLFGLEGGDGDKREVGEIN